MSDRNDCMMALTCAEYAAIELRVPQSGTPWLDAMITEARRMDYAQACITGTVGEGGTYAPGREHKFKEDAYRHADAMIAPLPCAEPQAAPEWPAMPEGLPPLDARYVYVGPYIVSDEKVRIATFPRMGIADGWIYETAACGGFHIHYAVHASDLAKVRKVQP